MKKRGLMETKLNKEERLYQKAEKTAAIVMGYKVADKDPLSLACATQLLVNFKRDKI